MSKDTMHFDTCIRNGTVVTAAERFRADIGIRGGRGAFLRRGEGRNQSDAQREK